MTVSRRLPRFSSGIFVKQGRAHSRLRRLALPKLTNSALVFDFQKFFDIWRDPNWANILR